MMSKIERSAFSNESKVVDVLRALGYPKESIVLEGQISSSRYVDFVITDIDSSLPLMMIEMKACNGWNKLRARQAAFETLKRAYDTGNSPIKAVAAILDRETEQLEFIDYTEAVKENDFNRAIDNYTLPSYEILKIGARQKAINKDVERQRESINGLKVICWIILPIVCVAMIMLDAFQIYTFSTLRLITIGAGAVATLLPCYKEIKIWEIHLKNQGGKNKDEDKTDE